MRWHHRGAAAKQTVCRRRKAPTFSSVTRHYAAWFNKRHERSGHLFQGRFHAFLIEKEAYFARVLRYVVLNPVRARMVVQASDYRWSSYRATAGLESAPEWFDGPAALALFGDDPNEAADHYRAFVNDASDERLWDRVTNAIYLGTESWCRGMRKRVESKPRSTDHPLKQRSVGRPSMPAIVKAVARAANVAPGAVRAAGGRQLRSLAAWLGWHEGLLTLRSIAAALRIRSEGHISMLIRRYREELSANPALLARLDASLAALRA